MKPFVRHASEVSPVPCPCGQATRIVTSADGAPCSFHITEIHDAERHYHERTTEVYSILEGTGKVELDGEWHDVRPGSVVFIPPARDIGLSVRRESKRSWSPCPPFDAGDEVNEIKQHRAQAMESSLLPSLALGAG